MIKWKQIPVTFHEYGQHWSTNSTWAIFQDIRLLRRVLLFLHFHAAWQLILRHHLHIVYYNETYHLCHEHAQLLCALWRHRHGSFCRRHHWSRRVRSPARAGASEAYLWTQIRLRFEASYNTRGPIRQRRQRHLSLRKQNSFNCTRLGSPALVEGQWPWGHVWRCGLVWKCMKKRNWKILFTCW